MGGLSWVHNLIHVRVIFVNIMNFQAVELYSTSCLNGFLDLKSTVVCHVFMEKNTLEPRYNTLKYNSIPYEKQNKIYIHVYLIVWSVTMKNVEILTDFELNNDTIYHTVTSELWGVYCEYFGEKWPFYSANFTILQCMCFKNWITIKPLIQGTSNPKT